MTEYIVELPDSGAADEFVAKMGVEDCRIYGYRLTGEVVRCMDCTWFANDAMHGAWCKNLGVSLHDDYDGFCAWGERREA